MVDPENVSIERTQYQLEEFMLFCIAVAGKNAKNIANALETFLYKHEPLGDTPFEIIKALDKRGRLKDAIQSSSLGQYNKLAKAYREVVELDLKTCTLEDLEKVHGIGFKTSRFFLTYTRPGQNFAILDVHILRYLREELGITSAPKGTPSSFKKYQELETAFINHCLEQNRKISDLDLEIWTKYSNKRIPTKA